MTQLAMNFAAHVSEAARRLETAFLEALSDGQWHRGRQLCAQLQTDERTLRKCADGSRGRVISGQSGYKLTVYATVEELDHAEAWLLSQARKMTERATEIRRARNAGGAAV